MSSTDVGQFIVRFVIFELGDIFILQLMIKILSVSLSPSRSEIISILRSSLYICSIGSIASAIYLYRVYKSLNRRNIGFLDL